MTERPWSFLFDFKFILTILLIVLYNKRTIKINDIYNVQFIW